MSINELKNRLFPEAHEQNEISLLWISRLKSWKIVCEELYTFIAEYHSLHDHVAESANRLSRGLFSVDPRYGLPEIEAADLSRLKELMNSVVGSQKAHARLIHDEILCGAMQLKSESQRKFKHFKAEAEKNLEKLSKQRDQAINALQKHLRAIDFACVKKSSDPSIIDPWLSERVVDQEMALMVEKENDIREKMVKLQSEMREYELNIVEDIKKLLVVYVTCYSGFSRDYSSGLELINGFLSGISGESTYEAFVASNSLKSIKCFHEEKKIEDFPSLFERKGREKVDIEREDLLFRPGKFRKASFKPCLFVLTKNGFLHCLNMKHASEDFEEVKADTTNRLQYSIYLRRPKVIVERSLLNMNCILIRCPLTPKPIMGKKEQRFLIKVSDSCKFQEWVDEISKHLLMNRDRPQVEE